MVTYLSGGRIQGASTDTTPASFTPTGSFNVRYIVVGGGAGSGTNNGGGGGSGAFRTNASYGVTAQTYDITVGAKSIGQLQADAADLSNGGDSSFGSIVSNGGGHGGQGSTVGGNSVNGSGGGGGDQGYSGGTGGGTYGFDGGDGGGSSAHGGGGGGGSSAVGTNATSGSGGTGGAGTNSDITGSTVNYAAGGGAGAQAGSAGQGGNNDAGDGAGSNAVGGNATTTTATSSAGNGAGGGTVSTNKGGDGSDGIVIIRFTTSGNSYTKSGGVVSTVGSDTLVTYLVGNAAASDASKTAITNVPTGTRYEETDTRKIFRMKVGASYDNDFASNSSTGWTLTPTYSTISGGTLNIQNTSSGHQHYASYDLGSGAVAENWVLRFKIIFDTYGHNQQGQACGYYFGLSSIPAASLTGETPTQGSYVAFNAAAHWSGSTQFYLAANSSGTQSTTGDSRADDLTITRYIEIVKNGTSLTNKIFTANTYAENVREETITLTLSANITNLRYIYNKFYYQGVTTDNTVKVDDIEFYNNSLTTFTEAWLEKGIA